MKMQKYLLKYIPGRFFIKGIIISIFASNLSLVNKFLIYMYVYIYIYIYTYIHIYLGTLFSVWSPS